MKTINTNSYKKLSETEGTGISFSESEGTGLSFSESEGTGIASHIKKVSIITKITLLSCLFFCNFSFANSLHLFSETNDLNVVNGVLHDQESNQIYRITGYFEKNHFVGLIDLPKSADDGSGAKSADDGSGDKSADDGSGGKSADDGSGYKTNSVFTYEMSCNSPGNQYANIKQSTSTINLELTQVYLNGNAANCKTLFSKFNNDIEG